MTETCKKYIYIYIYLKAVHTWFTFLSSANQKSWQRFGHTLRHTHQELRPPGPPHPPSTRWAIHTQVQCLHLGKKKNWQLIRKVKLVTAERGSDSDDHSFAASAVAIGMRQEPCLEMRHHVTTVASASLSALSHQTPSWIKSLTGEKRTSPCTAPRRHMVRHCDEVCVCVCERGNKREDWVQSHSVVLNHFTKNNHGAESPPAAPRLLIEKFQRVTEESSMIELKNVYRWNVSFESILIRLTTCFY